jgi:hypothetical protein
MKRSNRFHTDLKYKIRKLVIPEYERKEGSSVITAEAVETHRHQINARKEKGRIDAKQYKLRR